MRFDVLTLFPEMIQNAIRWGVTGKALENGSADLKLWNPRDFVEDRYRTVDDRPYGGGPGMVMKVEPLRDAIRAARADSDLPAETIYLSPQGKLLKQKDVERLAASSRLIVVAGRYEGIDERLIETEVDAEWSIGDYVLSGGELAVLVLFDAIVRLLPGVLGDMESAVQDSHSTGLLDFPHYTRPVELCGRKVPEVLLSGNHGAIERWRLKQALGRTWLRRPDLLAVFPLERRHRELLVEFQTELGVGKV
jgi:tRNA (guanine37-N1)-methyltransferase